LSNDALRHEWTEVMALVQEQLAVIDAVQKKQEELRVTATAADGMVEVTVNARGQLVKTVIDESYLDDFEFEELADHITQASEAAVRKATRRVSEMMAPISERRKGLPSLSQFVEGAPDLRDLLPQWVHSPAVSQLPDNGGSDETPFPTVRR
jgi:DNA-binding protein YbaB